MPKIVIFETPEPKPEQPVRLRLEQRVDSVLLMAVDEQGNCLPSGRILKILSDGTLHLIGACDVPGLSFDPAGTIKLS